jgi:DNA-binding IclR family transcriptional regulator
MSLPEMAAATGMSKSAAQRCAHTLETMDLLRKDDVTKRYSPTPRVLELGCRYLLVDSLVQRAGPFLLELGRACGESVSISQPSDVDVIYVGRFPGLAFAPVMLPIGRRLPMYCTAAGRAYLAHIDEDEAKDILRRSKIMKYTPTTVTNIDELLKLLRTARSRGFSTANGEFYKGDLGVGAPILDSNGRAIGAVSISAPSVRWSLKRAIEQFTPFLLDAADKMSKAPSAVD